MSELYNIYKELFNIISVHEKCNTMYEDLIEINKKLFSEIERSIVSLFGFIEESRPYNDALDLFKEIMNDNIGHLESVLIDYTTFTNHFISKKYFIMLVINRFIRIHYSLDNRNMYGDYAYQEWI